MLTALILVDNGRPALEQRVAMMHKLVMENILPALPASTPAMTPEEMFMNTGIRN